jgi:acetoin utilization deacetylase AcuC-like enzyme
MTAPRRPGRGGDGAPSGRSGRDRVVLVSAGAAEGHSAPGHPERPDRVTAIVDHLERRPALAGLPRVGPEPVDDQVLQSVHTAAHIAAIRDLAQRGGGWIDPDTYCSVGSFSAALGSVGAALAAVDAVREGRALHAFSIARPPGHHATSDRAMGFCLFNGAAIAVRYAQRSGVGRVAVVDIDVHHGNGTEEIFWNDPSVLYASLHEWPLFPGTGEASARGGPLARALTLNVPLPRGTTGEEWLARFEGEVLPAVALFRPELVLVSAGYDGHAADPLASWRLTAATYAAAATGLRDLCAGAGIGSVWLLEGGYDLAALGESVVATLGALVGDGEE